MYCCSVETGKRSLSGQRSMFGDPLTQEDCTFFKFYDTDVLFYVSSGFGSRAVLINDKVKLSVILFLNTEGQISLISEPGKD